MEASFKDNGATKTLRLVRDFPHPPEKVWKAITDPRELSAWWPMQIKEFPLTVGAKLHFTDEEGGSSNGEVIACEPMRTIAFSDEDGEHSVRFELSPTDTGTTLVFLHTFPADQPPGQHATGWHICFTALDALLDGGPVPPLGYDPDIRRQYDRLLGLAE